MRRVPIRTAKRRNGPIRLISVGEALEKSPIFREACERIADMLRQDDGEAFFEGEKFLKRHAPDLYDKIGMNPELGEGLRTEAEAQAEEEQK